MAMLDAETDRKLRVLGVPEMVVAYQEQTKSMDRVNQPFEKRLAELVDAAYQAKYNEKVEHLLKAAHLRFPLQMSLRSCTTIRDHSVGNLWMSSSPATLWSSTRA